jgi:hypothetical protein
MEHDIAVWVSLQDLRRDASSVLDSGAILLTTDYALCQFDWATLRKGKGHRVGTAVVAPHFMQILRPLVPATRDFDAQFVADVAGLEFRAAAADYSPLIGQVYAYFDTLRGLPDSIALDILTDEVLLTELSRVEGTPEFFDLLTDAVVDGVDIAEEDAAAHEGPQVQDLGDVIRAHRESGRKGLKERLKRAEAETSTMRYVPSIIAGTLAVVLVLDAPIVAPDLFRIQILIKLQIVAVAVLWTLIAGLLDRKLLRNGLILSLIITAVLVLSQIT